MKYARQIIDLLAAYPGRSFVPREIVRYVAPQANLNERVAVRKAVQRVLVALAATGQVNVVSPRQLGSAGRYTWCVLEKVRHEGVAKRDGNWDITRTQVAP